MFVLGMLFMLFARLTACTTSFPFFSLSLFLLFVFRFPLSSGSFLSNLLSSGYVCLRGRALDFASAVSVFLIAGCTGFISLSAFVFYFHVAITTKAVEVRLFGVCAFSRKGQWVYERLAGVPKLAVVRNSWLVDWLVWPVFLSLPIDRSVGFVSVCLVPSYG